MDNVLWHPYRQLTLYGVEQSCAWIKMIYYLVWQQMAFFVKKSYSEKLMEQNTKLSHELVLVERLHNSRK